MEEDTAGKISVLQLYLWHRGLTLIIWGKRGFIKIQYDSIHVKIKNSKTKHCIIKDINLRSKTINKKVRLH